MHLKYCLDFCVATEKQPLLLMPSTIATAFSNAAIRCQWWDPVAQRKTLLQTASNYVAELFEVWSYFQLENIKQFQLW